jgi:hypothetical protein
MREPNQDQVTFKREFRVFAINDLVNKTISLRPRLKR